MRHLQVTSVFTSLQTLVGRHACLVALTLCAFVMPALASSHGENLIPKAPVQPELPAPPPMRYVPGMEEPLIATGPVTESEDRDLDAALLAFHDAPAKAGPVSDYDDYARPLLAFIDAHQASNWNASLYLNIGLGFYKSGYYSRTFSYFERAWFLGRDATSIQAKRMADRAMGELAEMHARLGHADDLKAFFGEVGDRPVSGSASFMMEGAHEGLASFEHRPEISYLCGPAALKNVLLWLKARPEQVKVADDARSGPHGFSLSQLATLADKAGLKYDLIYRQPGQPVPVPSIINWKVHHYAAILDSHDGHFRLQDPTFGSAGSVVTEKAADEEGSGYFLVPAEVLAAHSDSGWRIISHDSAEANSVYGMGNTFSAFPGCVTCNDTSTPSPNSGTTGSGSQMTLASAKLSKASLTLSDTPVGYTPQKGLSSKVAITYNARDGDQPGNFSFSNLSPLWAHSWQSYVQDDPNNPGSNVVRIVGGGGGYDYNVLAQLSQSVYNASTGAFVAETYDNSQLMRVPATGPLTAYVRNLPDGGQETYGLSNGATTAPRIMFLTAVTDPAGNKTSLQYDGQFRLTSITDAMDRKTTFTYGIAAYPLLITKISDPFGRSSSLTYDTHERLSSITDPIGITSSFAYGSSSEPEFVTQLTTPYGTSKFSDQLNQNIPRTCCLELSLAMTDPTGAVEYVHVYQNQGVTGTGPEAVVPAGMENDNPYLMWRNTYYWNAHEAANGGVATDANGNPTAENFAHPDIYHWFHQCCTINYLSPQLASHKRPLEKYRQWYNTNPIYNTGYFSGTFNMPTATGRVLDDGSTQLSTASYNNLGHLLTTTDPIGRTTNYVYAANNIDLLTTQQLTASPSTYQTIASLSNYNAAHEPQTITGANGQSWQYSYNAAGQVTTTTDPNADATTYNYDTLGRLSTVINANQKTVLTLTYDSADRVATRTDSEGYELTYAYDNLDRVTQITYPDGTTDTYDYTFQSGPLAGKPSLDMRKHTDRLGNTTTYGYDADRRLISVTEPTEGSATRTTSYAYYEDGTLKQIIDPNGNVTLWNIDLQSRPISKTYAFGTSVAQTENYTYEATTSRLHSVKDAIGQVKTFTYAHDNRLTDVTYTNAVNPTPNVHFAWDPFFARRTSMTDGTGTTTYSYQPVGSAGALQLANEIGPYKNATIAYQYDALSRLMSRTVDTTKESFKYDSLSRLVTDQNELGAFALGYLGQTQQLTSQASNANVGTQWSYDTNVNDRRLKSVINLGAGRSFAFQTKPENLITSVQVLPASDKTGAYHEGQPAWEYSYDDVYRITQATPPTGAGDAAVYDAASNIVSGTRQGMTYTGTYNALNELSDINRTPLTYDANGNVIDDAYNKTYEWDAENRLIKVTHRDNAQISTTFRYDGLGRRVAILYTSAGTPQELHYLWCGEQICQSRTVSDAVSRHYYSEGEYLSVSSVGLYYGQDQLRSVRNALSTISGSSLGSTDYDPVGLVLSADGAPQTDFGYAGMFTDNHDDIYLTHFRAYDPVTNRWLSRDPLRETSSTNLYTYVGADPIDWLDQRGLSVTLPRTSTMVDNTLSKAVPLNLPPSQSSGLPESPSLPSSQAGNSCSNNGSNQSSQPSPIQIAQYPPMDPDPFKNPPLPTPTKPPKPPNVPGGPSLPPL